MNRQILLSEIKFKAVRSSGAGGQNVNKVSSKVVLTFDLANSKAFSDEEKILLEQNNNISAKDLDLVHLVDTEDEVLNILNSFYEEYNLSPNF